MNLIDRLDKLFGANPSATNQDEAEEGIMNMEEAPPPTEPSPTTVAVSTGLDDRPQVSNLTDSISPTSPSQEVATSPNDERLSFRLENVNALHSLTEMLQSKSPTHTAKMESSTNQEDTDKELLKVAVIPTVEHQVTEGESNDSAGGSPPPPPYDTASMILKDEELGKLGSKTDEGLPCKKEIFEQKLDQLPPGLDRRAAILATLRELGVKVYVIDGSTPLSTQELLRKVCLVTGVVAKENTVEPWTGPLGYPRCVLYQDSNGRLFNLTLPEHTVGPLGRWQEYLDTFSSTQAIAALMVLCRSFPCSADGKNVSTNLKLDIVVFPPPTH